MQVQSLTAEQKFVTAGGLDGPDKDKAWGVGGSGVGPCSDFDANHEEADTRVWFHASKFAKAIVYSPDTDTFMIGLTSVCQHHFQAVVRADMPGAKEPMYLDITRLVDCISRDPDMVHFDISERAGILQSAFVASGCDFTSFFYGVGKGTFFKALFQHASFIAEGPGSLSEVSSPDGFLSFLRLIAAAYYIRHRPAFHTTLGNLFAELSGNGSEQSKHHTFITELSKIIWPRTTTEDDSIPSLSALQLHWQRSCWVLQVWRQANFGEMEVPSTATHGWQLTDGALAITWDTPESLDAIQALVESLTSGCQCKSGCSSKRCKCFKKGRECSTGCRCRNCKNLQDSAQPHEPESSSSSADSESDSSESDNGVC